MPIIKHILQHENFDDDTYMSDLRLDVECKELIATILSLPNNQYFSSLELPSILYCEKNKLSIKMQELEKYGYIKRIEKRTSDGKMDKSIYYVSNIPISEETYNAYILAEQANKDNKTLHIPKFKFCPKNLLECNKEIVKTPLKFEEQNYKDVSNLPQVFIYFLLNDESEVVYVGQTQNGLERVYDHRRNKVFSNMYIIECKADRLDELENYFIFKYCPKYNSIPNYNCCHSIDHLRNLLKKQCNLSGYQWTNRRCNRLFSRLQISPMEFKNKKYITNKDCDKIITYLKKYKQ